MPGNELGDRVHNFFAQDNPLQGQHESHVMEGNWPVHNNNFWVGSPRQSDVLNSSEIDRGQQSYPVHAAHGLNFSQSNLRPDFSRSQPLNEQQFPNGFMYGNQFYQSRQNEANFLAVDTDSDQRHTIASRGLLVHELQQGSGHEPQKASHRSESVPPVSFDLFGGQQQMGQQQASMLQVFQHQQSGSSDMQQLQKQLMLRKMQELQRQSQLQQLDLRHQNLNFPPITIQASGSHSPLVNSTPNSDALRNPWTTEPSTNWLTRGSSAMQGSPSGVAFLPKHGLTQRLMDFPQQIDQSLYGVPVSNSRGLVVNQHPQGMTERSSMPQIATSSNSVHGNHHNFLSDRSSGQEATFMSRQKFQNENNENASSQSLNTGRMGMGFLQQVNSLQSDPTQHELAGRQELATRSQTSHERSRMQISSPQDEASLDPAEEKILYGSDDNVWAAFGKSPNISGEAGDLFDTGGLSNGVPSMQSGSWSALMQSAVAETSSNDIGPQEEWSGLMFHNTDSSSANQFPSVHNDNVPPSNINTSNPMESSPPGQSFQKDPSGRVPTDISQRFVEGGQIHGNASQNSLNGERIPKTVSTAWAPGHSGNRSQPNGWSALTAAVSSGGDGVLNILEAEKESQNPQKNQVRVMQGELVHGSSLWNSSSVPSANEMGPVRSVTGNRQGSKGVTGLHDTTSSAANSFSIGVGDGASPFVQNNYLLNQWKNASPSAKFQGGEGMGRMMDQVNEQNQGPLNSSDKEEVTRYNRENSAVKENSNDSHHSNLSRHASGGFRETGFSDAIDSRSMPSGKQKSANQLASKVSVPRKFQYHPMGNLDADVEPTHGLKQPAQGQAISLQNAHFVQSKLFSQSSSNSMEKVEPLKDYRCPDREASGGSFSGYEPCTPIPSSRPFDSYTTKASLPSQNMLELLHKVDQSRDHDSVVHLTSSEYSVSPQLPEAEKNDGSTQHSQCSSAQGFGLQLGPPSQLLQNPDLSSPSRNAQDTVSSMHTSHAGTKRGEKGLFTVPASSAQSLPFPNEGSRTEIGSDRSAGQGHRGSNSSLSKGPGNHYPAFTSDTLYTRSQLQNKQIASVSGKAAADQHIGSSFGSNTSRSMQRGSTETVVQDASGNLKKDNLPSSVSTARRPGRYGVQEMDPTTASTRDQIRSSQPFGLPDISRPGSSSQFMHNMWTKVPTSQNTLAAQYPKAPLLSELTQPNILESGAQGDLDDSKGGNISSKTNAIHASSPVGVDGEEHRLMKSSGQIASFMDVGSAPKTDLPLRRASSIKNNFDDSPANSASTQDIEAFGRSLKPNVFPNEKLALLNQMRALKDAENDPSIRFSKKMKVPADILDIYQANLTNEKQNEDNIGDSLGSNIGFPSEDSRMLRFSTQSDALQKKTSPHRNAASEAIVAAGLQDSLSNPSADVTTGGVEHHSVSPQMAPSWFNQYGSFKNWQPLPMHNACMRPEESPAILGKSSSVMDIPNLEDKSTGPVVACQVGSTFLNSAPMSEGNTSADSLEPNVTGEDQVILRPKKRKSATSDLHPWWKEISDGSRCLSMLGVAEVDWSNAANHLTEKVEEDVELIEDGPPLLRSKKRLIITTQLMQQLLRPPTETVLSADASSKYECVAYTVSRIALGDACSALSSSKKMGLPCDVNHFHAVKGDNPHFAKVIDDLLGKTRKLENDFLRLDKSASILDLRLECQDLEKFSVINRFAKFHGRGQGDNSETSSTEATSATHKPCAQRFVTAVPIPKSLPDRVQCLSL